MSYGIPRLFENFAYTDLAYNYSLSSGVTLNQKLAIPLGYLKVYVNSNWPLLLRKRPYPKYTRIIEASQSET